MPTKKTKPAPKAPKEGDVVVSISATGARVVYRAPDSTWIIANFRDKEYTEFTAVGDMLFPGPNEPIELQGKWVDSPRYGRQFEVLSSYSPPPVTPSGLKAYLSKRIEGIGPAKADALVNKFGVRLTSIIEKEPNRLSECPGISTKLIQKIKDSWHSDQVDRHLTMYLAKHGISTEKKYAILSVFGPERAIPTIEANPYELTKVPGIGFIKADAIARGMGYKEDCIERVEAAIIYCLQESTLVGHCFLPEGDIIESVHTITKCEKGKVSEALTLLNGNKRIEIETASVPGQKEQYRLIYLPGIYNSEKNLARDILEILATPIKSVGSISSLVMEFEEKTKVTLTTKQKEAVQHAFDHRISIVTGAPGVGKTLLIRAIIYVAERLGVDFKLAAPTGRAARRIAEVTGEEAKTIHRLLEYREEGFYRNRQNPLDSSILIIDEFSMPDIHLAANFFEAVGDLSNVVLVGDIDQLPAVGPGTVLRDLITFGKIPTTVLDTVFRQAEKSLIVQNAHKIRSGVPPVFLPKGTPADSYIMLVPRKRNESGANGEDTDWVKNILRDLVITHIPRHMASQGGCDPIRDIQVIVPMKKGTAGVYELNRMLRDVLNKDGRRFTVGQTEWRIGDRVMQMKNNYDLDVSNGDVGFILSHDVVEKTVDIEFYHQTVTYKYKEMPFLELAYASTVHKSQGSEYPVVILVLLWQHRPMLDKNLLYTANTRARKLAMYVASPGVTQYAVENTKVQQRNSFLMQRLKGKGQNE